jgi:hypothetical protein
MMSIQSTLIALGHCAIGSTKLPMKNIGISWSPAFFIPARHYQNAQKHWDHSHPGVRDKTPAADALLTTIVTTTITKMEVTTATMVETTMTTNCEDANSPPHHHDMYPPHMSHNQIAHPHPPNMNLNDGSMTPISASKLGIACPIHSQF